MDPISIATTVLQLAIIVHEQIQLASANRVELADLADRTGGLRALLQQMASNRALAQINITLLHRLEKELIKARDFTQRLADNSSATKARAFFGAQRVQADLADLNARISQAVTDLQAAVSVAHANRSEENFDNVNAKLDAQTKMLEQLQSLLLASALMGGQQQQQAQQQAQQQHQAQQHAAQRNAMSVKRRNTPNGLSDESVALPEADDGSTEAYSSGAGVKDVDEAESDSAGSSSSSAGTGSAAQSVHKQRPLIGRVIEVAAHQFIYGSFMAALSLLADQSYYRAVILLLSPLLPLAIMDGLWLVLVLNMLLRAPTSAGISILLFLPSSWSHVSAAARRTAAVCSLYLAPVCGSLVSLALFSFFDAPPAANNREEYGRALLGVAGGTLLFALGYAATSSS